MNRVALFGASGFVGTAVFDHLARSHHWDVLPIIHSSGNAWELGRRGIELCSADLRDPTQIDKALKGCTHVVNCSRGSDDVMILGISNLVKACRKAGVQRFVHLSSVAVYGDPPRPEAHREDARPKIDNSYAQVKLEQDCIVAKAAGQGLSAVVLCPPNITGAGSDFMVDVVNALGDGTFALIEGSWPVNLVDVRNLAAAVESALSVPGGEVDDANRVFVTDGESVDWLRLVCEVADMSDVPLAAVPRYPESLARQVVPEALQSRGSILGSAKHLVSGEVRAVLRKDPFLTRVDFGVRGLVPTRLEDRVRWWINGPTRVAEIRDEDKFEASWFRLQLRGVQHECSRAREAINYNPILSFTESVASFRDWYRTYHGWDTPSWNLAQEL